MDQRPPPEVTIRDPARPQQPLDVLLLGDEEPPSRAAKRLRVTAAGAVLVLLAGVAAVADVRERQQAANEEQRLASVVDLRVGALDSASGGYDETTDQATLELVLPVRNRGPRDVVVLSGGVDGYGLARPVEVRAGAQGMLRLTQTVDCATVADWPAAPTDTLELSVRTGAGVRPRRVELPLPSPLAHQHAWHPCGGTPLELAVALAIVDVHEEPRTLRFTVEARSTSRRPVALVAVRAVAPGYAATSPDLSAGPVTLPPPGGPHAGTSTIQVHLTLVECAAAAAAPEPLALVVLAEDDRGREEPLHLPVDAWLYQTLVDSSC